MDEKVIVAFAKWMQAKDKQLAKVPTEQLAQQVVEALQTEEGQKQLQPLFKQFQTEMQGGMFKSGGKLDQAVKKMQPGGATEKVKAPRREIQSSEDPRLQDGLRKNNTSTYDGLTYYKHGDIWSEYEDPEKRGSIAVPGTLKHEILESNSYHIPSRRVLDAQRNYGSEHQQVVDEDGNTAYTLSRTAAIPTTQEAVAIIDGKNVEPRIDSLITRNHGVRRPQYASNTDLSVKLYRNNPYFRKAADFVGFVPAFEKWKVMFDKSKK
jgi:hypothetical protein